MTRRPRLGWLVWVFVVAMAAFVVLLVAVTTSSPLAADSHAFELIDQLRAPWLDHTARLITKLGLLVVVGPVLLVGAAVLARNRYRRRAEALLGGAALAWTTVWITKVAVDRPRPSGSLVHTAGQSFPSGHAANAVGWLALAIALSVLIPTRAGRALAIACGALLTALVGLSRIYLRAHYLSDVLAGEALATAMYAGATLLVLTWRGRRSRIAA